MNLTHPVARAVRRALLAGAMTSAAVPVFAQDADDKLETVVVTGSRISNPNLTSTSPVTQVTADDITAQGVVRVEDLISQLPQAFAAQGSTLSNASDGTATVDLRGIGSSRTLVLVDGRRLPYGSPNNSAADLNTIPAQLIERVEVLTGGASAVYGSDAIAGVVNFITKKDFEGVDISAQYSFNQHNNSFDGPGATKLRDVLAARAATNPSQFQLPDSNVSDGYTKEGTILIGASTDDGRANFTAWFNVNQNDATLQSERDFSACALAANNPTVSFACGGSGTAAPGTFTDFATFSYTVDANNNFRNFNSALDQYNYGPLNYFLRPATRYNGGAMGHFEINERVDVYTQLMFTDYSSVAQIAPGGAFFDNSTINCDNPFLSAQQLTAISCTPALIAAGGSVPLYIGRRNVEGGGRQSRFEKQTFRAVVGLRGAVSENWNYDVSAVRSSGKGTQSDDNYFVIPRIAQALDAIRLPSGEIVCRDQSGGCAPYNVFQIGGVTQAALNFLQAPGLQQAKIDQEVYTAAITGDLGPSGLKLPTAEDGIQLAAGVEYRRDKLVNIADSLKTDFLLSGGSQVVSLRGTTDVTDIFVEANIPLVQGKAFAESLSLDTAYRYSDYGDISTDTYKLGLEWAPIEDVKLRGSVQRAVRAANIIELFSAQSASLFDIDGDPCGAVAPNPNATAAECIATGVPAGLVGSTFLDSPAGQYNNRIGGNPALTPEEADTYTFGLILKPRFAPGLVMSVDWFSIEVANTVGVFGAANTLDACYNLGDAASCANIVRNPNNGSLWNGESRVNDLNDNLGSIETSGIDINATYSGLEVGSAGSLSFSFAGTHLEKLVTTNAPGIPSFDCAGKFASNCVSTASGIPAPKWRHQFRVGWETPWDLDLSFTWRYLSSVDQFNGSSTRIDNTLSAESYFDLSGTYSLNDKSSVTLGVNNILDEDPSLSTSVGTTGNGNTYPQVYDSLGRYVFARVRFGF